MSKVENRDMAITILDRYLAGWRDGATILRGKRNRYSDRLVERINFGESMVVGVSDNKLMLRLGKSSIEIRIESGNLEMSEFDKDIVIGRPRTIHVGANKRWVASITHDPVFGDRENIQVNANLGSIKYGNVLMDAGRVFDRYKLYLETNTPDFSWMIHKLMTSEDEISILRNSHYNGAWKIEMSRESHFIRSVLTIERLDAQVAAFLDAKHYRREYLRKVDLRELNDALMGEVGKDWVDLSMISTKDIFSLLEDRFGEKIEKFNYMLDADSTVKIRHGIIFNTIVSRNMIGVETDYEKLLLRKVRDKWLIDICTDDSRSLLTVGADISPTTRIIHEKELFPINRFMDLLVLVDNAWDKFDRVIDNMYGIYDDISNAVKQRKALESIVKLNPMSDFRLVTRPEKPKDASDYYEYIGFRSEFTNRFSPENITLNITMDFPERSDDGYDTDDVINHINAVANLHIRY